MPKANFTLKKQAAAALTEVISLKTGKEMCTYLQFKNRKQSHET
jgi:hypothetical protein